jgi:hypothetical protein
MACNPSAPHRSFASRRLRKKQNENGKNMNLDITFDQPNEVARATRKMPRNRRPLPPQDTRGWMTPNETALALGCIVATFHRRRRGMIPEVKPLPCIQYGWRFVFRKALIAGQAEVSPGRVV